MIVTNLTDEALGIKGVSVPAGQSRKVRGFNPDGRRERELLDAGAISVPEPTAVEPEESGTEEETSRGWFGGRVEYPEEL